MMYRLAARAACALSAGLFLAASASAQDRFATSVVQFNQGGGTGLFNTGLILGGPRGGGRLCGGEVCLRDTMGVESGTRMEIGCHHAEMNVVCNAAANGVPTRGAWLIVTGEPCMMCAKLIHHAGIERVLIVEGGYMGANGVQYLEGHGVEVQRVEGPKDPRSGGDGAGPGGNRRNRHGLRGRTRPRPHAARRRT